MDDRKPHPIQGSRFWRVWCKGCHEPMRVPESQIGLSNYCEDCDGRKPGLLCDALTPRQFEKRCEMFEGDDA